MGNSTEIVLTFKSGTLSKCCHIVLLPHFFLRKGKVVLVRMLLQDICQNVFRCSIKPQAFFWVGMFLEKRVGNPTTESLSICFSSGLYRPVCSNVTLCCLLFLAHLVLLCLIFF